MDVPSRVLLPLRRVLLVGATGKQGSAVIDALLDLPDPVRRSMRILALTRNTKSPRAQALVKLSAVTLVQGHMQQPEAIFKEHGDKIDIIFLVTVPASAGE